jgi:hypothetical protein
MQPSTSPRVTKTGAFTLPCAPQTALPLFTPEGERGWVPAWAPIYLSGATDEVGAVWTTATHDVSTTWVTVVRDDDQVAYARVSDTGTAGLVSVRCLPADEGTNVHVTYDLTATTEAGAAWLQHFSGGYHDMPQEWRNPTLRLVT